MAFEDESQETVVLLRNNSHNTKNDMINYSNYKHRNSSSNGESENYLIEKSEIIASHNDNENKSSSIYEIFLINKHKRVRSAARAGVLNRTNRSTYLNTSSSSANNIKINLSGMKRVKGGKLKSTLDRNERSANLSHITGSARKIQLYIKNRFLQILPDGTVNGTMDDLSDYCKYRLSFVLMRQ
jgi:hypothetical protein